MKTATLKDGYGTTISFATSDLSLILDPQSITPPGADGGDAIDTTTHSNDAWRTKHPRSLKELAEGTFTAAYDVSDLSTIYGAINVNQLITVTFPDNSVLKFYGYLKSFTPGELTEGDMPTAECAIVVTCEDDTGAESAPTFV